MEEDDVKDEDFELSPAKKAEDVKLPFKEVVLKKKKNYI